MEDGADRGFLSREEWATRPGEESSECPVAARGKRRSRPLPTKAIDEAVGERGSGFRAQGDLARIGWRVQCPADTPCAAKRTRWTCRIKTQHSADRTANENAPSHRISAADCGRAADRRFPRNVATGSVKAASRADPPACSRAATGIGISQSGRYPLVWQLTPAPAPRPALPDGALWRSWFGARAGGGTPPAPFHAARRCSSASSIASAVSASPPSAASAAPAAAGSGSSGASGSTSHTARVAVATVATPPRWV